MDKATIDWMLANLPSVELTDENGNGIGRYITPPARLSFSHLDKPSKMDGAAGEAKYSASLIFPPAADLSLLKKAAGDAAFAKWGDKTKQVASRPGFSPFYAQAEKDWDGYGDDGLFIRVSSQFPIVLLGEGGAEANDLITLPNPRWYDGIWVRGQVNCYAYEQTGNAGVRFGGIVLQKIADDEEFKGNGGEAIKSMGAIKLPGAAGNSSAPATAPKTAGANLF